MGFSVPSASAADRRAAERRRRSILRSYLAAVEQGVDWESPRYRRLEACFAAMAADYGAENGISLEAWLQFGVPPRVLEAAGILSSGQSPPPRPHMASRSWRL